MFLADASIRSEYYSGYEGALKGEQSEAYVFPGLI